MAHKIVPVTPNKLLTIVCTYYGLKSVKKLATPARPDLWRHPAVFEEARQVACWILRRQCDLSLEELQVALKQLKWNGAFLRLAAEQAQRKLAEGDFALRLAVENIEQLLLATLIGKKKGNC